MMPAEQIREQLHKLMAGPCSDSDLRALIDEALAAPPADAGSRPRPEPIRSSLSADCKADHLQAIADKLMILADRFNELRDGEPPDVDQMMERARECHRKDLELMRGMAPAIMHSPDEQRALFQLATLIGDGRLVAIESVTCDDEGRTSTADRPRVLAIQPARRQPPQDAT